MWLGQFWAWDSARFVVGSIVAGVEGIHQHALQGIAIADSMASLREVALLLPLATPFRALQPGWPTSGGCVLFELANRKLGLEQKCMPFHFLLVAPCCVQMVVVKPPLRPPIGPQGVGFCLLSAVCWLLFERYVCQTPSTRDMVVVAGQLRSLATRVVSHKQGRYNAAGLCRRAALTIHMAYIQQACGGVCHTPRCCISRPAGFGLRVRV